MQYIIINYIIFYEECWHSDPNKRSSATDILEIFDKIHDNERNNFTEIIKSPDIGHVTINNPSAIYKSRPLSGND